MVSVGRLATDGSNGCIHPCPDDFGSIAVLAQVLLQSLEAGPPAFHGRRRPRKSDDQSTSGSRVAAGQLPDGRTQSILSLPCACEAVFHVAFSVEVLNRANYAAREGRRHMATIRSRASKVKPKKA